MNRLWILLALTALVAPACRKGGATCDKFVEQSISCDADFASMSGDEKSQSKMLLEGMCEAAFSEQVGDVKGETKKMMLEMYATMRNKAKCVAAAKDCAAAKACDKLDN